jgi:hypothetical protein
MTITMGLASSMPAEAAGKSAGKSKQNSAHAGAEAVSGGFESVLASLDEDRSADSAEDSAAKASNVDASSDLTGAPVATQSETEATRQMLLAGAGHSAKEQVNADAASDADLAPRGADADVSLSGQIPSLDVVNADLAGTMPKPATDAAQPGSLNGQVPSLDADVVGAMPKPATDAVRSASLNVQIPGLDMVNADVAETMSQPATDAARLPQSRLAGVQSDVGHHRIGTLLDGAKGEAVSAEERNSANAKFLKAAKDEKLTRSQGVLGVSDDARIKAKEVVFEQLKVADEEMGQGFDLLKNAVSEPVKRVQDFFAAQQSFVDTLGNAHSEATTHANFKSLDGVPELLPADAAASETQVSYWTAGDVQKAEMTLDGLGEDPVGVSISVHGKDADVAFRTDEIQTRALLEASGNKLKDLLSREGMVLTGMSVGGNGSGNPNPHGNGRRHQQSSVKTLFDGVDSVVRRESGVRSAGVIGKSLDLFV